jgi:hypothetical protein
MPRRRRLVRGRTAERTPVTLVNAETGEIVGRTLEDCEAVIERGLATFVEVGEALAEVRDLRLYRATHDTFEAYCDQRWSLSRKRAYDLIGAAEIVGSLSPIGDTPKPANEAQARALRPVKDEPEQMAEAMRHAATSTGGKPTAAAIATAVQDLVASTEQKKQDAADLKALVDEVAPEGFDATANAEAVRQRGEFARLCRDLAKLPAPDEFVKRQGDDLRERHISYAEAAYSWLDEFLLTVKEDS